MPFERERENMKVSIGDGSCGYCGEKAYFVGGLVFVDGKKDKHAMCFSCVDEMFKKLEKVRAKSAYNKRGSVASRYASIAKPLQPRGVAREEMND